VIHRQSHSSSHQQTDAQPVFKQRPPVFTAENDIIMEPEAGDIPLVSWGQLSCLCPLPASCPPPAYSLRGK